VAGGRLRLRQRRGQAPLLRGGGGRNSSPPRQVAPHLTPPLTPPRRQYILGYVARDNRLVLVDKTLALAPYALSTAALEFKTAVVRGDVDGAMAMLPSIPLDQHNRVARFLDAQGHKALALSVATDADFKFELALQLGQLNVAREIAAASPSDARWRLLADLALSVGDVRLSIFEFSP
jgi:coatomer subunit beta'